MEIGICQNASAEAAVSNQRSYVEFQGRKRPFRAGKQPQNGLIFIEKCPIFARF
jgi:hypothetical protein